MNVQSNRNTPKNFIRYIALTVVLLLMGCGLSCAQNNYYKMNDDLYADYQKAYKMRKTEEGRALAESIIRRAVKAGDKNGEVVAMTIPFLYEFYKPDNLAAVEQQANRLLTKAKEYEAWAVYFFAVSNKVNYLVRLHLYVHALIYAYEQKEFAEQNNIKTGIRDIYYMIGTVQQYREEYVDAVKNYQLYIDYAKQNLKRSNVTDGYLAICDCYRKTSLYDIMRREALAAEESCNSAYDRYDVRVQQCYANFMTGHYKDFRTDYAWIQTHQNDNRGLRDIVQRAIKVCKAIDDRDYNDAEIMINEINKESEFESLRLAIALNLHRGDYKNASRLRWNLIDIFTYSAHSMVSNDRQSLQDKLTINANSIKKQRLDALNTQLQLDNTQLLLTNSRLQLSRANDTTRLANILAEQNLQKLQQQEISTNLLKDSIKQQQQLQAIETAHNNSTKRGESIILAIMLIIIVVTIIYVNNQRRQAKTMRQGISQLHNNIRDLNVSRYKAQENEMMKTGFLQNMSHEIRTPLNAIVGFSNILSTMGDDLTDEERAEYIKYIIDNSNLLTTLVDDILVITDLQTSNYVVTTEEVRVNELCRETIETVRHRAADGVELRFNTTLGEKFIASTDRKRVQQVLINMLTNAEKNTTEGSITLDCRLAPDDPNKIAFTVTDTGCGVPPEKMDSIFERFKKLNSKKQGSGLGLDICRTIANKLGGSIDIDKTYTTGARFFFIIPFRS